MAELTLEGLLVHGMGPIEDLKLSSILGEYCPQRWYIDGATRFPQVTIFITLFTYLQSHPTTEIR